MHRDDIQRLSQPPIPPREKRSVFWTPSSATAIPSPSLSLQSQRLPLLSPSLALTPFELRGEEHTNPSHESKSNAKIFGKAREVCNFKDRCKSG
eukprot:33312-Rhodomonas_salina.1